MNFIPLHLKKSLKVVFFLITSMGFGIVVTLIADMMENIAVEKKIRQTLEWEIKNAVVSFKDSTPNSSSDELVAFLQRYTETVLRDKVLVQEKRPQKLPENGESQFLFTLKDKNLSMDFFLKNSFLKSELAILDFVDYISGIIATIVIFTSIVLYTESKKDFEMRHAEISNALEHHKALALLGRMSASLAHELKTPISTISNLVQTLPSRYTNKHFVERFSNLVREELNRTQVLIDNLLVYGKDIDIRNGEWIPFESFLRGLVQDKTLTLQLEDLSGTMIFGDRFYLDLLFKNFFRNSLEARASQFRIRVCFPHSLQESSAEIFCEDNGEGFPPEIETEKLIEPFVTSRSRGGGLGLYLAKKIAMAHGGALTLSRLERGASIKILWPKERIKMHG
ncbi:MAG: HAMP domain-containing histidine kinase [Candidatus Riflebacteria bacterium]|nr:HAMP domain-containing histidine kinase [Candidatus Riflebacteria bacterium]